MKTYAISLVVDEEWLEVIKNITKDVYAPEETCSWISVEEVE